MNELTKNGSMFGTTLAAVLALAWPSVGCSSVVPGDPAVASSDAASTGECPVSIDVPSANEATGEYVQISVTQKCAGWTESMIAYVDGERCDEKPYAYPNTGCATKGDAQNFSKSTWLRVSPGRHSIIVNNWNRTGTVGSSSSVTFTYTPKKDAGADAEPSKDSGAAKDAGAHDDGGAGVDGGSATDALPPGTVTFTNLEKSMFEIANGAADHCETVDGHQYCGGSCNGTCAGTSTLSTYAIATGLASPAMSGSASSRVDVSNPAGCTADGSCGTDTLEWVKIDPAAKGTGAYADDTHFVWDFYFYPTETTHVQAYEFDAFYGSNGWWLMLGSQCDLASGNWNGWNEATGHWTTSGVENCGSFFTLDAWNHIVIRYHRDPGPVGSTTHYYYDALEVNGVSHAWGLPGYTGKENGWGDVFGAQVQQDLEPSFTGTLSSYYDGFTFQISP